MQFSLIDCRSLQGGHFSNLVIFYVFGRNLKQRHLLKMKESLKALISLKIFASLAC